MTEVSGYSDEYDEDEDITNLGEEFSEIWMEKGPSSEYFTHGSSEDGNGPYRAKNLPQIGKEIPDAQSKNNSYSPEITDRLAWDIPIDDLQVTKKASVHRARKKLDLTTPDSENFDNYTPPKNLATPQLMSESRVLDLRRWYCLSRPQYKTSCGLSSLVSCWNYLFSTLGQGKNSPITQEEAMTVLGFKPPFSEIGFGPFTGNLTLIRWFRELNIHYGVRGRSFYVYKPQGKSQTSGVSSTDALQSLKRGLKSDDTAYIYHCQNHYFCPMGFEDMSKREEDAYKLNLPQEDLQTSLLIGDPSRAYPAIHCVRWDDITKDLNTKNPDFFDIRKLWKGQLQRNVKKKGGNLHCLMAFKRTSQQTYNKSNKIPQVDHVRAVSSSTKSRTGGQKTRRASTGSRSNTALAETRDSIVLLDHSPVLSSSFTSGSFPSMPHSLHEDLFTGGVRVATRSSTSSNWKQQCRDRLQILKTKVDPRTVSGQVKVSRDHNTHQSTFTVTNLRNKQLCHSIINKDAILLPLMTSNRGWQVTAFAQNMAKVEKIFVSIEFKKKETAGTFKRVFDACRKHCVDSFDKGKKEVAAMFPSGDYSLSNADTQFLETADTSLFTEPKAGVSDDIFAEMMQELNLSQCSEGLGTLTESGGDTYRVEDSLIEHSQEESIKYKEPSGTYSSVNASANVSNHKFVSDDKVEVPYALSTMSAGSAVDNKNYATSETHNSLPASTDNINSFLIGDRLDHHSRPLSLEPVYPNSSHLIHGDLPFNHETSMDSMLTKLREPVSFVGHSSPSLFRQNVAKGMTAVDPEVAAFFSTGSGDH